ncbi:hypothetical protein D9615_001914 [Tricholomella constricta]|uniref:Wings apart-like protein C-terminal domain-containing protein n=1 Tax=Tricholomella constricta TaxID=117010 RepID=A0A8H5HNJ5_9AGAR|nr:hypothetical protein D9615_001914 [Tricholomella constricta]
MAASLDADSEPRKKQRPSEELTDVEDRSPSPSPSPLRTYGTPKRGLAKDLSSIFQSYTPSSSPHATPTKLASRMLGRSKTDSSIDSTSADRTPLYADRTSSLPALFSPKRSASGSSIQDVRPPPVPLTTNTRTYAGKSRSFLVAVPASSLAADEGEDEYTARESYASLRSRWGVDNSEDDPYPSILSPTRSDSTSTPGGTPSRSGRGKTKAQQAAPLPNGMMNPLKSITELRNKGESRRFLDEVGYLFEGMHSTVGIGLRRASALEITTKLCDADFSRKAKAADFLSRAWDVFGEAGAGKGEDKILDTLLAFFAALVSRDPASLRDLAQRPLAVTPSPVAAESSKPRSNQIQTLSVSRLSSLVDTLFSLLTAPSDPLSFISKSSLKDKVKVEGELKRTGIGKKERATFQTIHDTIFSKSSLFPANTPISTPLLVLHALKTLPPSLIPQKHLPTLLASLRHTLAPLLPSSSSITPASNSASLSWPDAAPALPYESAFCHLRMLDVYLLGQWGTTTHTAMPGDADPFADADESERRVEEERERRANETAMGPWLADALVAVAVCAELSTAASSWGSSSGAGSGSARKCMETALRVLVSLTHADAVWARRIAESECALAFVLRVVVGDSGGRRVGGEVKKEEDGGKDGKSKEEGRDIKLEEEFGDESPGADDNHGSDDDHRMQSIDVLCLALGLLTNLIQGVPGFKDVLRDARTYIPFSRCHLRKKKIDASPHQGLNPACTLKKRACIRRCTCAPTKSISALDVLIRVYNHHQPNPHLSSSINTTSTATTDTRRPKAKQDHDLPPPPLSPPHRDLDLGDALFLRGHLAVVFGLLIRGSPENEAYILRALAGSTSGDDAEVAVVRRLAEQAREFVAFYVALGGGAGEGEGAGDGVEDMRVARGVVMFLEGLRA